MKKGFTLAEVLITLGIIGIVAAMTLPQLILKYKEQETVTRVKKFYSVFSQAYTQAILDNGTIDNWGLSDSVQEEDDDGFMVSSPESLENYDKFFRIMKPYLKNVTYEKLKGKENNTGWVLPDGTAIVAMWLSPSTCVNDKSYCGDFYINTSSKDYKKYDDNKNKILNDNIFAFKLHKNRISPVGITNNEFKNYCLTGKNYSKCTGWIILNGNMDYLHCNDLSWDGKTKCSR